MPICFPQYGGIAAPYLHQQELNIILDRQYNTISIHFPIYLEREENGESTQTAFN